MKIKCNYVVYVCVFYFFTNCKNKSEEKKDPEKILKQEPLFTNSEFEPKNPYILSKESALYDITSALSYRLQPENPSQNLFLQGVPNRLYKFGSLKDTFFAVESHKNAEAEDPSIISNTKYESTPNDFENSCTSDNLNNTKLNAQGDTIEFKIDRDLSSCTIQAFAKTSSANKFTDISILYKEIRSIKIKCAGLNLSEFNGKSLKDLSEYKTTGLCKNKISETIAYGKVERNISYKNIATGKKSSSKTVSVSATSDGSGGYCKEKKLTDGTQEIENCTEQSKTTILENIINDEIFDGNINGKEQITTWTAKNMKGKYSENEGWYKEGKFEFLHNGWKGNVVFSPTNAPTFTATSKGEIVTGSFAPVVYSEPIK